MPLTSTGRNKAADGVATAATYVGLADESLTELTGGSPAYARQAVAWDAAASGVADNTASESWDIPAGTTVAFFLFRDASSGGTDLGYAPLGGHEPKGATFLESTDTFTCPGHGYSNTQRVLVYPVQGGSVPSGFTTGTLYYVIGATTDTFQLSTTSGGSAVTSTQSRSVIVQRCSPETFASQGTLTAAAGDLDIDARLV